MENIEANISNRNYLLITGVSTGIGLASAQYFLARDYFVFGSVRHVTDANRLKETLGPRFHPLVFDVCDGSAIALAVKEVTAIVGSQGLAGLVNNAGIAVSGPLALVPIEDIRYQLEVNVLGVIQVTQQFLPLLGAQLPARKNPGRIVNISSVSGAFAAPFIGPYCASKYALEAISDSWRRELLLYGIDVISIRPGPIRTPIWQKAIKQNNTYLESDYAALLKQSERMIRQSEASSIPAEKVAEVVYRAVVRHRPKTRYVVAKNKWSYALLFYWLPDRWVDFFIRRAIFSHKKKP